MTWLGLDIGGANLKLADGHGYVDSRPFALWRDHEDLTSQLRLLIAQAPPADHLAVTMTGELADCFASKEAGVKFILEAVQRAADGRHTRVYLSDGKMVTPTVAGRRWSDVAAANWHALAVFAGRRVPRGNALLVDVGSTTTDLIPLMDGEIVSTGRDDTSRLLASELIYLGVERTPLCALLNELPYRDQACPVARELFATTRDAYLILGDLAEDPTCRQTADGAPATKSRARVRLGRMLLADHSSFNHRDAVAIAREVDRASITLLANGIRTVAARLESNWETIILAGAGEFLVRRALEELDVSPRQFAFSQEFSSGISKCAPAHAVASLAREAAA